MFCAEIYRDLDGSVLNTNQSLQILGTLLFPGKREFRKSVKNFREFPEIPGIIKIYIDRYLPIYPWQKNIFHTFIYITYLTIRLGLR